MALVRMKSPEGSTEQIPKLQTADAILNQLVTTSKPISPKAILMLAYHLILGLLSDCFQRGLFSELLYEFPVPPIRATRSATSLFHYPYNRRNR
jgi:hypothetical protein